MTTASLPGGTTPASGVMVISCRTSSLLMAKLKRTSYFSVFFRTSCFTQSSTTRCAPKSIPTCGSCGNLMSMWMS